MPLVVQFITPTFGAVLGPYPYPAGIVYETVLAHTSAEVVGPCVANGTESIVSVNVAVAGVVHAPLVTDIVSVTTDPFVSFEPKVYVGVVVCALLVNVPLPLVVQFITPTFGAVLGPYPYPAGIVYETVLAQTSAEVVGPCVANGTESIVSVNVAVAGVVHAPFVTDIVSVTVEPFLSFVPNVYVGDTVFPLVKLPSPLDVQLITPTFGAVLGPYPYAGTLYESVLAHTSADVVAPGVADGTESIVSVNVVVDGVVHAPVVTDIVSVTVDPFLSFVPKLYVGATVFPLVKLPSPLDVQFTVAVLYGKAEYPTTEYEFVLAHTSAVIVAAGIAYGTESIVNVKVDKESAPQTSVTCILRTTTAPESNVPKL